MNILEKADSWLRQDMARNYNVAYEDIANACMIIIQLSNALKAANEKLSRAGIENEN